MKKLRLAALLLAVLLVFTSVFAACARVTPPPTETEVKIKAQSIQKTTKSITLTVPSSRLEYGLFLGETQVKDFTAPVLGKVVFTGLEQGKAYDIKARVPAAGKNKVSEAVKVTTVTTLAIPAAPLAVQLQLAEGDLKNGLESLSLTVPSSDYEYCIKQEDEFIKGWKKATEGVVVFDGLQRNSEYDIYARVPAAEDINAYGIAALVASFTTSSDVTVEEAFEAWLDRQFLIEMYESSTISVHYTLKDTLAYDEALDLISVELEAEWEKAVGDIYSIDDVRMYSIDLADLEDTSNEDLEELLAEVLAFDDAYLNTSQRLLKAILVQYLETNMTDESINLNYYGTYFDTSSGVQSNMPINFAEYTFYKELDVQIYLKLLEKLGEFFQQCLDYEKAREEKGLGLSDKSLTAAIEQCEAFLECTDETETKNYLITTFNTRIDAMGLDEATAQNYKAQNIEVFINYVAPAYQLLIDELPKFKTEGEYDYEGEENEFGLSYFDHGKEYYEYLIAYTTGSKDSVDTMYDRLTKRLASAINTYMKHYNKGGAAYEASMAWETKAKTSADTDKNSEISREELLAYAGKCIERLQEIIALKFPAIPENEYNLKLVEKALEETLTSSAFFMIPPIDDYLNNVIYINEANSGIDTLFSLLAHEGFPGHLYQNVYHLDTAPHEMRSVFSFNGYAEGWASYVEHLAYEWFDYGTYDKEICEIFQSWDTWVLCILCAADIGVNYKDWTYSDFSSFMSSNNLTPSQETYDFFVASPGTYVKYGIGFLEMTDMRAYAEKELGSAFDEKAFHKVILDVGPCQFNLVWAAVEDYVSLEKAKAEVLSGYN